MQYTVEFSVSPFLLDKEYGKHLLVNSKRNSQCRLGEMIGDMIEFEEIDKEAKRHRLRVEAFSSNDWREFKQELKKYIESTAFTAFDLSAIGSMIHKLESIGAEKIETEKQNNFG